MTAVALPLMVEPAPDTAERRRLELQAIPLALPEKRAESEVSGYFPLPITIAQGVATVAQALEDMGQAHRIGDIVVGQPFDSPFGRVRWIGCGAEPRTSWPVQEKPPAPPEPPVPEPPAPVTLDAIDSWYRREREAMVHEPGGLILGGLLYGQKFLDIFERFSLPTILAPQNRRALAADRAVIALYTDAATAPALEQLRLRASWHGIDMIVRIVPDEVIQNPAFWVRLATAQALWCQRAARSGRPYHMYMPDQSYDETYFLRLLGLATRHRRIAHVGLNTNMTAAPDLERYRQRDGSLTIPTACLTDIAWQHLHWRMSRHVLNKATPEKMPNMHYQTWRARDRVMVFTPHCNTAYMDAATCGLMEDERINHTTIDARIQGLFELDFYVPTFEDGMSYIGLEYPGRGREPPEWPVHVGMEDFLARCCGETRYRPEYLAYYERAHEIPASPVAFWPEAEEVRARQMELVGRMRQRLQEAAA